MTLSRPKERKEEHEKDNVLDVSLKRVQSDEGADGQRCPDGRIDKIASKGDENDSFVIVDQQSRCAHQRKGEKQSRPPQKQDQELQCPKDGHKQSDDSVDCALCRSESVWRPDRWFKRQTRERERESSREREREANGPG